MNKGIKVGLYPDAEVILTYKEHSEFFMEFKIKLTDLRKGHRFFFGEDLLEVKDIVINQPQDPDNSWVFVERVGA